MCNELYILYSHYEIHNFFFFALCAINAQNSGSSCIWRTGGCHPVALSGCCTLRLWLLHSVVVAWRATGGRGCGLAGLSVHRDDNPICSWLAKYCEIGPLFRDTSFCVLGCTFWKRWRNFQILEQVFIIADFLDPEPCRIIQWWRLGPYGYCVSEVKTRRPGSCEHCRIYINLFFKAIS